jgi:hypothetical protein
MRRLVGGWFIFVRLCNMSVRLSHRGGEAKCHRAGTLNEACGDTASLSLGAPGNRRGPYPLRRKAEDPNRVSLSREFGLQLQCALTFEYPNLPQPSSRDRDFESLRKPGRVD